MVEPMPVLAPPVGFNSWTSNVRSPSVLLVHLNIVTLIEVCRCPSANVRRPAPACNIHQLTQYTRYAQKIGQQFLLHCIKYWAMFGSRTDLLSSCCSWGDLIQKEGSIVSNEIGMEFDRNVLQVNKYRLTIGINNPSWFCMWKNVLTYEIWKYIDQEIRL